MRPHVIFRYIGFVMLLNGIFLFISALVAMLYSDNSLFPLIYSGIVSTLIGIFPIIFVPPTTDINNKEGFFIVVTSWLIVCLVGVMPYVLWGGPFTLINAWFESVSGFTTTGSSILSNVEALPMGLLFWRSTTHWIGGVGIIIFVLSVIPYMGKAGMILYRMGISSLAMNNFHYRTKMTIRILLYVYIMLTLFETILLHLCGMNLFDSITHSFATIATGGFSTKNLSIAYYNSPSIEIVIIVFMILSGIHFGLLFGVTSGKISEIWKSTVVRYYIIALIIGTVITMMSVRMHNYDTWLVSLRYSAFQIITLGTSTGFATADTSIWPSLAKLIMIFFILQCACAGSTSGGIKADRVVIFWKAFQKRLVQFRHPSAVIVPKINNVAIKEDELEMGILYISLYMAIVFLSSILLAALGVDSLTAFSASAATMGNVGPGFGMVGSMSNFGNIPEIGKLILTGTMLLGRLEIFGLIILFPTR
ncbi:MAG: TrkH family potassium uptake protein [Deltaproteobacteria bacterium]|nr:TrkH family potassium uptake protein [Deltaproteobacteria bacterium]